MSDPALIIMPNDKIIFNEPFKSETNTALTLSNASMEKAIAFKVKCTDNTKFKIKPVMGIIQAGGSETVILTRIPFDFDPANVPKDAFGVFNVYTTASSASEAFQDVEAKCHKLEVAYQIENAVSDAISAVPEGTQEPALAS